LGNIGIGTRFIPISEDIHPEYKEKNHDFLFVKTDSKWQLIEKANRLKTPTEEAKEIEEIFQKGNSLSREGKYKEALEHVERSMAMDSSLYQRYSFRADLKAKLGMYESAISDMSICIERCNCTYRESHISSYLIKRASFHEQNEDFESALKDAIESIQYNSESWQSYLYRGQLLAKSQQFEEALNDLNKSAQLNDNRPEIFITRGLIHAKLGNMENACSDFKIVKDWGFDEAKQWIKENCK
jgi:tetratricopeptide (TPR) repeat protein